MMTSEKISEEVKNFSKTTSDLVRQLSLAGLAIIWLFKIDTSSSVGSGNASPTTTAPTIVAKVTATITDVTKDLDKLPHLPHNSTLIWAAIFFIITICIDFLSSLIPTIFFFSILYFNRVDDEINVSNRGPILGFWIFCIKAISLIIGYCFLLTFLFEVLQFSHK